MKKSLSLKSKKGFTLIELLIFMGIFSILMTVMFQLLTSIFDVQLESQSSSGVISDGNYILNRLGYDIKNSTGITSPNVGSQSSALSFSSGATNYTYSLSNGNLIIYNSLLNSTDQLNSVDTTITNLNFQRLSDTEGKYNTVTMTFTIVSKVIRRNGFNSQSFKTTIGTR